jgi:hypothetical protein
MEDIRRIIWRKMENNNKLAAVGGNPASVSMDEVKKIKSGPVSRVLFLLAQATIIYLD